MAEKKLKISLDLDDKNFNASIKRMQEQLSQINSGPQQVAQMRQISQNMQKAGLGTMPGAPSQQQYEQSQKKYREDLIKGLDSTKAKYKELIDQKDKLLQREKDMSYEAKQSLGIDEQKLKLEKQMNDEMVKAAATTEKISRMDKESGKDLKSLGTNIPKVGALVASVLMGAGSAVTAVSRLPLDAASAMGKANTSLVGRQLQEMTDPYHLAFLPERQEAMKNAKQAQEGQRAGDSLKTMALIATGLTGAAITAASALGVPFTMGASTLGLGVGGAMMGTAAAGLITDPKKLALSTGNREAYEKLSASDLADLVQQSQKAEEEANPLKKMAAEYNAQNYQRNLGIQRGLGLEDKDFMGKQGFLQRNMNYGGKTQFTEEQVTDMQQQILGAGGSARLGREAGAGLQLQKDYNLNNAPQMLANISKTLGGAQETKEASAKVIAEAFKQGLNDSDLVDLLRGFTQSTSEFIARSGARTQADVSRITEQFGKGMVENTSTGLDAAKTAYEAYQKLSSQQSGPFSIMQRAAMLRDPIGKRISNMGQEGSMLFEQLKKIPAGELTENHPVVQEIMYKANLQEGQPKLSPKDIIGMQERANKSGSDVTGNTQQMSKKVRAWLDKAGFNSMTEAKRLGADIPPEILSAARQTGLWATAPGTGLSSEITKGQEMESIGASLTPGSARFFPRPLAAGMTTKEEKSADKEMAARSAGQQTLIENFEKFNKVLTPTAEAVRAVTVELIRLGQVAADIKAGKRDAGDLAKEATKMGTQPQSSSASAVTGGWGFGMGKM
jgi:hypothetical protein